jgi:hypothetical protein
MNCIMHRMQVLLVIGTSLILGSCRPGEQAEAESGKSDAREPCPRREILVRAVPEDSFPQADRCRLVDLAVTSVGKAMPSSGLVPADTSAISSALLVPVSQTTPEGTLIRATWHVTLSLHDRPYDAEVMIDRTNSHVTVSRIHKPM